MLAPSDSSAVPPGNWSSGGLIGTWPQFQQRSPGIVRIVSPADLRRVHDALSAFSQPFAHQYGRTGGPDHPDRPAVQREIRVSHPLYLPCRDC